MKNKNKNKKKNRNNMLFKKLLIIKSKLLMINKLNTIKYYGKGIHLNKLHGK